MTEVVTRFKAERIGGLKHRARLAALPCCIPECGWFGVDLHHERRGTGGGTSLKPGPEALIPICRAHHTEGHQIGWATFEKKYGVDLKLIAHGHALVSQGMGLLPKESD
jgi:hypothetical protein